MMEMTSNHIPITQLHVSHFFVLEPPILPQSYATRITTSLEIKHAAGNFQPRTEGAGAPEVRPHYCAVAKAMERYTPSLFAAYHGLHRPHGAPPPPVCIPEEGSQGLGGSESLEGSVKPLGSLTLFLHLSKRISDGAPGSEGH